MADREFLLLAIRAGASAAVSVGSLVWWLVSRRASAAVVVPPKEEEKAKSADWGGKLRGLRVEVDATGTFSGKALLLAELVGGVMNIPSMREDVLGRYAKACYPGRLSDNQVMGLPVILGLPFMLALSLTGIFTVPPLILAGPVLGFGIGYAIINGWISNKGQERRADIGRTMPFVMDLIVMSMNAGASFQMALEQVVSDYAGRPVGDEFGGVLGAVYNGAPLAEAMETFRSRIENIPVAEAFADDVIQSQRLGRPLAQTLSQSSERFKKLRIQIATELAGEAKVKILVPGILILFASLMILFGPFAVKFFSQDQGMDMGF